MTSFGVQAILHDAKSLFLKVEVIGIQKSSFSLSTLVFIFLFWGKGGGMLSY
jgi:hypothetical protein